MLSVRVFLCAAFLPSGGPVGAVWVVKRQQKKTSRRDAEMESGRSPLPGRPELMDTPVSGQVMHMTDSWRVGAVCCVTNLLL